MTKKGEARRPLPLVRYSRISAKIGFVTTGFRVDWIPQRLCRTLCAYNGTYPPPGLQLESEFSCGFVRNRIVAPEILKILVGGEAADFRLVDIQFTA